MVARLRRQFVLPAIIPVAVAIVVAILIIGIGESLLALFNPDASSELARPELWVALAAALGVLAGGAFLATRPAGSVGLLDKEVAIGSRGFFEPDPVRVAPTAHLRIGEVGGVDQIAPGDTLYARNGPLARVLGVLPGGDDYGRPRRGLIYAEGLYGASDELWIPYEAVLAVYPETHSVFLAIKGDETEHFGWNRPPEGLRRGPKNDRLPGSP